MHSDDASGDCFEDSTVDSRFTHIFFYILPCLGNRVVYRCNFNPDKQTAFASYGTDRVLGFILFFYQFQFSTFRIKNFFTLCNFSTHPRGNTSLVNPEESEEEWQRNDRAKLYRFASNRSLNTGCFTIRIHAVLRIGINHHKRAVEMIQSTSKNSRLSPSVYVSYIQTSRSTRTQPARAGFLFPRPAYSAPFYVRSQAGSISLVR